MVFELTKERSRAALPALEPLEVLRRLVPLVVYRLGAENLSPLLAALLTLRGLPLLYGFYWVK